MGDDFSATGAGFGAEVDNVVCFSGEVHMVFDDDDSVAFVDETVEDVGESGDVLLVESDSGFLDEVEIGIGRADVGDLGAAFGELGYEFEALRFAAGDGGGRLAESEVSQPGFGEELEGFLEFGVGGKKLGGGFDVEIENVSNGESVVADLERGGVVALAKAAFAIDPGGGEEIHFQFDATVAFALGALALLVVEGKAGGGVAAHAGFGKLGEEGADVVEEFDVGGWAGA